MSRPSRRAPFAAVVTAGGLLAVSAAAAYADPTSLFAPLPWSAFQVTSMRGLWSVAGVAVFLPVLVAVTAWGTAVSFRGAAENTGRKRMVLRLWGVTILATALARLAEMIAETAGAGVHGGARTLVATALWDCGLPASRVALVGWIPALLGAFAHRYRPRGEESRRRRLPTPPHFGWRWSLTGTVLPIALLGPLVGPMLWEGSPAAAFYGEPLSLRRLPFGLDLGPARFAVELATAAIVGAILLARSSRRFDYTRPADLLLGGWLAALGGGAAAGVVQTALALPRDLPGTDLFVLADAGLRIGTGLSLGVAFGWAVVPTLLLISRLLDAISGGRRRFATVLASATALAVGSWGLAQATPSVATPAPAIGATARATAAAALPALTVRAATSDSPALISDVNGRQVLLRGVNVNQLVDYAAPTPGRATVRPLGDTDFASMAALGFDVVRLDISWSALEPSRGHYDQGYLDRIKATVAMAARHGLYTDLDMHEDAWGPAIAAPAGTTCPSGSTPSLGYDGAPAWATLTDGASRCQTLSRDLTPANTQAFSAFYHDSDGIQTELVHTWAMLARTFADDPSVAGYGLLNEPGMGDDPPATSSVLLGAFENRAVQAIRQAEQQTTGGFPHLVFIEPSVLWSGLGFDAAPPRGFSADPYLVFAPHLYSESITMDRSLGLTLVSVERGFALAEQQAKSYGMPLWAGEWGWFGSTTGSSPDPSGDPAMLRRFAAAEDQARIGDAYWAWRQACGSPESDQHATVVGNLVAEDCATGKDVPPSAATIAVLGRAYPRAVPGALTSLTSDTASKAFALTGVAPAATAGGPACTLDVWYPGATKPTPSTTGIAQLTVRQVTGGWRVTGCASGRYRLSIG
ncbi:cellulase family glycosylhydrolase [Streptacidiphilus anmyonensis]|uniref:cellulase family glycosylhydrolase n=1 Tax=Streptacidiphilus anmyonensis TaxID=405782 RepID=UPI000693EFA1|nr:cellulase family glycosylhydrolase [Streptacidiphilus anmyonensis]